MDNAHPLLVTRVFEALNAKHVCYVVLRNHDRLATEPDIDLLVEKGARSIIHFVLSGLGFLSFSTPHAGSDVFYVAYDSDAKRFILFQMAFELS